MVKDYDGGNFNAIETINGVNYKAVLMPAENTKHGFSIWLASNIAASQKKYCPVLPNNGELLSDKKVFFINEWNGFDWDKKELQEGDSLMIKFGPDCDKDAEYRLVNGELINIKKDIISTVENKYDNDIDDLQSRVNVIEEEIGEIKQSIAVINDKIVELDAKDKSLDEKIDAEIEERKEVDTQLLGNIEELKEADAQILASLSAETEERKEVDAKLREDIDAEKERSVAMDEYLKGRLISQSGSTYNFAEGFLMLVTDDPNNTIRIDLDSNYGEF